MTIRIDVTYDGPVNLEFEEALTYWVAQMGLHPHKVQHDGTGDQQTDLRYSTEEPPDGFWRPYTLEERDELARALQGGASFPTD